MQPYSDYEIAQRRIAERQSNKSRFRVLLVVLGILVVIAIVGGESAFCTVPIGIITMLFVLSYGIELYYTNPDHAPNEVEIEQEMGWLFGENWQEQSSTQAHTLAQDRIRERRVIKWRFLGHFLAYMPINGWIIVSSIKDSHLEGITFLGLVIWFFVFIYHAQSVFPTKRMLEEREKNFGETLQYELAHLQPSQVKRKEKLKRGKYYRVGDDGELEEVEDEVVMLEEKTKRESGKTLL